MIHVHNSYCHPETQVPLPGGYQAGDVVYAIYNLETPNEEIAIGRKGVVTRLARLARLASETCTEHTDLIVVDFGDVATKKKFYVNTRAKFISKTDPTCEFDQDGADPNALKGGKKAKKGKGKKGKKGKKKK